jgi:hypothetical protein
MSDKAILHQLIEDLPESELVAAERFLAYETWQTPCAVLY